MRARILAEHYGWLTTGDLARMVERTSRGARWIADQEQLTCERTSAGFRLFRESDVLTLVKQRANTRLRKVNALRPKKLQARGEPRQLSLFRRDGEKVSLPEAEVRRADSRRK